MTKSIVHFFFLLLLASVSLCAASNWQQSKQTFHHNKFQFLLPAPLEASKQDHIQYWKAEADGNCYWVAAKQRRCNQGKAPVKICDVTPILRSIIQNPVFVSQKKDSKGYLHFVLKEEEDPFFYYTSVCFNDEIVVVLMTKTPQQEPADHQKFIESFTFLN